MPVAIIAVPGDPAANSFVTLAEATAYMLGRLNSTPWDSASTDQQNRALVEATMEISALYWKGTQATSTQALQWPRWFVPNPDVLWSGPFYYDSTIVPVRVKNATMELAFQFLVAGTTDIASLDPTIGIKIDKVDVLSTEYFEPARRARGLARFPRVMNFIRLLLNNADGTMAIVRG